MSAESLIKDGIDTYKSNDETPRHFVSGIDLDPITKDADFPSWKLYHSQFSVLPVVIERPGEEWGRGKNFVKALPDEEIKRECERRMSASFLVVCDYGKNAFSGREEISAENFKYILFPKAVYDSYVNDPLKRRFSPNTKAIVINDFVTRFIDDGIDMNMEVPDYESALKNILEKDNKSLFVHGVRLPLEDEKTMFQKAPTPPDSDL